MNSSGILSRLRGSSGVQAIDRFLRTPWYVALVGLAVVLCYLFSLELAVYTAFVLIGLYLSLMGQDFLPLMPLVVGCYIAPSFSNNPGRQTESVFYPGNGGIFLFTMGGLFFVSVILRLVFDKELGRQFLKTKRSLIGGMALLSVGYLLGGVGMDGYLKLAADNLLFAAIQVASVVVMYVLFTGAVRWEKAPRDYLAWVGLMMGFAVMIQLLENYLTGRVFQEGTVNRELIATGWGMHNNVGLMIAISIPFALYLAKTKRRGWIFTVLATVLLVGTGMSCSRSSIMVGALGYLVGSFLLLRRKEDRKIHLPVYLVTVSVLALTVAVLFKQLLGVFEMFLSQMDSVSKRDELFANGMMQFVEHPLFGGSFYPQGDFVPWDWANLEAFSSFFPPRWHNTLVQVAASCGAVGLTGYFFHRFQTVRLFWKRRSVENTFIAISMLALLGAGLLDCHFFNVGPVLFYSMALAFAEKLPQE